jgi:hypothetical protein
MVIARLAILRIPLAGDLADVDQRNAIAQEGRQGDLFGLKRSVRELNPKSDTQALAPGRVERQSPDRIQIEAAGPRLHVAPIAANVQDIDEWQAGDLFDMLLQSFSAGASRKGRPTFFPAVSHQPKPRISQRLFRRAGEQNRLPALVLFNIEGSLVQTLSRRLRKRDGMVPRRAGCKLQSSQSRENCSGFQEVSATHIRDIPWVRIVNSNLHVHGCFR